jgi:drug/metabolite transporter (DMT)-like permease
MAASSGSRPTQLDSAYSPPDFDSYPVSQGTAGVLLAFASALLWALSNTVSRRVARYGAGGVVVPHGATRPGLLSSLLKWNFASHILQDPRLVSCCAGEALFSPKEPTWWASSCCAIAAEVVQFSAFALSPVTLIAPIASSSSIVFTVLSAHHFTNEALNMFGVLGCMLWAAGCLPLVLTVPEEEEFTSIAQIWSHALQPGGTPISACTALSISGPHSCTP